MALPAADPLPSAPAESAPASSLAGGVAAPPAPARPPPQPVKLSTMAIVFCGILGLFMLLNLDGLRTGISQALGSANFPTGPLYIAFGFNSQYLLATMAIAGVIEMAITALAYTYTTDWVKAARFQKWSAAFRKAQMAAIRSGKKDRIDALKPSQGKMQRLGAEVQVGTLKGMAITYFLLILIYSWVGNVISYAPSHVVNIGGGSFDLMATVWVIPAWIVIFSLYTLPFSFLFRRLLKDYWLVRYERDHPTVRRPTTA